ncbi:helicase-related protein [Candidatus Bipolaricaulota sp. J31]
MLHAEPRADGVLLVVRFLGSGRAESVILSREELRTRIEVLPAPLQDFPKRALKVREPFVLYLESIRFSLAYAFDPHYAVSVTQVDLLPHQVHAIYKHILPLPKVRFLLADDPGLGKTIMAGLVVKELKARGLLRNLLLIVPAHLIEQWRREFKEWFREDLTPLPRDPYFSEAFFERNPFIIASMDTAKQERYLKLLASREWDLVIVDEAHKFSVSRTGAKEKKTRRFVLGETLASRTTHYLFLTATPHKGDDYAYFRLLSLLEPRLFAGPDQLKTAAKAKEISFVLRRSKEQVTDLQGRRLFKPRRVETISVPLTEIERELYDAVTEYVRTWYSRVSGRKDRRSRNVALGLTVLQRRMASSTAAIKESLIRRRNRLRAALERWERVLLNQELPEWDEEALEALQDETEERRAELEEKLLSLTAAANPDELRREISELERLIVLAQRAEDAQTESKVEELRRVVERYLQNDPDEKLLVFTEFKDTLMGLVRRFRSWGYEVAVIHGGMPMDERIEQERLFRDKVQVMVATDAAGEGLNLQFCRLMVNYDLPWNPNRLEQRMGRVHRYGQKREVFVYNLLYEETIEGKVLKKLLDKLDRMRERLGDTVFDVIGDVLHGVRLEDRIMQALLQGDSTAVEVELEERTEEALEEFRRALEEYALAGQHLDLTAIQEEEPRSRIFRIVPWDVERFVKVAVPFIGGQVQPDKNPGVWRVSVPREFAKRYDLPESHVRGLRVAFERKAARNANPQAEFLAPGHPLFDALTAHFGTADELPRKAVLVDPGGRHGSLWVYRVRVIDGNRVPVLERLLAFFRDHRSGGVSVVDPRMVWDLESPETEVAPEWAEGLEGAEPEVRTLAFRETDAVYEEALRRREREARIKRKHLERTFDALIDESNRKLLDYARREEEGEDVRLARSEEEKRLKGLLKEREERLKELERETSLTRLEPELLAVALVVPREAVREAPAQGPAEETKRRIEEIGMRVAMKHERREGREPRDVSKEFLGYDIVSQGAGETRYIEVKAFATSGPLELTPHEWQMARRLGDQYWIYVVEDALVEPRLTPIRDPVRTLPSPQEVVDVVKVVIRDWRRQEDG